MKLSELRNKLEKLDGNLDVWVDPDNYADFIIIYKGFPGLESDYIFFIGKGQYGFWCDDRNVLEII